MNQIQNENPFGEEKRIVKGLELYPITMEHYHIWEDAKPALTLRLSSLPAAFAAMPYVSAVYALELQSMQAGNPVGMLRRLVNLVCLSMRLDIGLASQTVRFSIDRNDQTRLLAVLIYPMGWVTERVQCTIPGTLTLRSTACAAYGEDAPLCYINGGETPAPVLNGNTVQYDGFMEDWASVRYFSSGEPVSFKPSEFGKLREAIAALNGAELPDETENPELVQARNDLAALKSVALDYSLRDLVDSVALASGVRTQDLRLWSIHEFETRKRSIDRAKHFTVNGIAEGSGCSWKGGNPVPSWCYDRAVDQYGGMTPMSSVMGKLGSTEQYAEQQINAIGATGKE